MKRIINITVLSLFVLSLLADENDIIFSGEYANISFQKFAFEVEKQTGAKFYYHDAWISNILITVKGDQLSLNDVLTKYLKENDLNFYINSENKIFITPGKKLITKLPEYNLSNTEIKKDINAEENGLTNTEKKYLAGRKNGVTETIIVGKKQPVYQKANSIVNGVIKDKNTGEPLIGATIYIEELSKGSVTNINGYFTISLPPGKYSALFNCLGMEEAHYFLQVNSSGTVNVEMDKKLIEINEVSIKADRYHNVRGMQMGFERISIKEIKEIPVVMGEKDVLKVAQMLPGVQNVGEGSSGFNVRGSAADQNMFFINKIPVYNTSHLFGFFSTFSPDIVKDFSFYKGNIPAKFGGRLSSFFDISTRQGNKKKYTARGGISPVTGHMSVEGPIKKDKSSLVLSARSTYSDWLLTRLQDAELRNSNANFYDLSANINIERNEKSFFKMFGYYSYDQFSLSKTNFYQYSNLGGSINYWHQFSSKLNSDISVIYSKYSFNTIDSVNQVMAYQQNYQINHYEIKSEFTWMPLDNHIMSFGANTILYNLNRGNIDPVGEESIRIPVSLGKELGNENAIYASDEYQVNDWLTIYGGFRYSLYFYLGPNMVYKYNTGSPKNSQSIIDTFNYSSGEVIQPYRGPEVRGSFNVKSGPNSSVKLSYNRTRQYLFMLSNTIAISPNDQWKLCDYHISPPYSDQVSVGFYKDFLEYDISFSSEVYYKNVNNTIEYKDGADFITSSNIETEVLQGKQEAYGIELMLKKNSGRLTGWVSSSFSKSEVLVNGNSAWEKINGGIPFPANYDKPVAINTILNYRLNRRLSFSSNIVYNSGRPVTYPVSIYYINKQEHILYSTRNKYRIPDYFRIDLSFNLEGTLKARKIAHSYWMLNIYNITGRENAYSVFFKSENGKVKGYKMSIFGVPIVTLSWNFKLGNYASD
ncbi:carboxypeptidase-like regulatory domain-containing protein [Bacteroidota bacterium]